MNEIRPKLIIFDLDGTLADTADSIKEAAASALAELDFPARDEAHVRRSVGNGATKLCLRILPEDSRDDETVARLLDAYERHYSVTYTHVRELYPEMSETIEELHRRGYLMAVFSNRQDAYVKELCRRLLPDGYFSVAEGQLEGRPIKPDPATALDICRRLGVSPSDAVMVGDGETDAELALRGGLTPVSVTWGFRTREQIAAAGGYIFATHPAELLEIFAK